MNNLHQKIIAWLQELGNNRTEVAASLRKLGIKGKRKSGCNCPLSNYLKGKLPDGGGELATTLSEVEGYSFGESFNVFFGVPGLFQFTDFVSDFDCGLYPELEEAP